MLAHPPVLAPAPALAAGSTRQPGPCPGTDEATARVRVRPAGGTIGRPAAAEPPAPPAPEDVVTAVRLYDAAAAEKLRDAFDALPEIGGTAFGFRLVGELGRGAFGRVYLATQPDLAGRYVALKVAADLVGESRHLARLQHAHIVPVYSVHRAGPLHGVVMPYLGAETLAGALRRAFLGGRPATGAGLLPEAAAGPECDALRALPYPRAAARVVARLADGLAHAHARGILHRDIKPGNCLLADDGTPMLLDFGVAEELRARRATVTHVGGTPAYMAPEVFEELETGAARADARSDVYALGLVLYELLTGRQALPPISGHDAAEVAEALKARAAGPAPVPDITPGLASILRTALHADPDRRYQSATFFRDDLDAYVADRPLVVAPDPSARERLAKWARRHPRLSSGGAVAAAAAAVLVALGAGAAARVHSVRGLEAAATERAFAADWAGAQTLLTEGIADPPALAAGADRGRAALARFGVLDHDDWAARRPFAALPPAAQARVRADVAAALALLARADWKGGNAAAALALNAKAEAAAAPGRVPWVVYAQRATFLKGTGRDPAAAEAAAAANPPSGARDFYLAGADADARGDAAAAIDYYRKAQAADPRSFWAYYSEGYCAQRRGDFAAARAAFTAATAAGPEFAVARMARGLAEYALGRSAAALADFDAALELDPALTNAVAARAAAHYDLKQYGAALADVDAALAGGIRPERLLVLRAKIQRATGAAADDAAAVPQSAAEFVVRGLVRLAESPARALADFDAAAALDPGDAKIHVYRAYCADAQGRVADCIPMLSKAVALDPHYAQAYAGRGVMHARLGHWADAKADAEAALARGPVPGVAYQVAGIYSLLSKHDPEFAAEAVMLLGVALRGGYGADLLPTDRELDPVRDTPAFKAAVRKYAKPGA